MYGVVQSINTDASALGVPIVSVVSGAMRPLLKNSMVVADFIMFLKVPVLTLQLPIRGVGINEVI